MFKWLSKILTPSVDKAQEEAKVIQKTVTKNGVGYAPKIEPVITEVKKVSTKVEVKSEKVTKASLSKLTKVKLEEFALATYGVDIDRRKKKEDLVKEVLKLSKKV
jgi:BMFP domain-containing protein YqiC